MYSEKKLLLKKELDSLSFDEIKGSNASPHLITADLILWDGRGTVLGYADVAWQSSAVHIISSTGQVERQKTNAAVTLTACFSFQDHPEITEKKQFALTVLSGKSKHTPEDEKDENPRIFIAGDSTACAYPHTGENNRYPQTGWGQMLPHFLDEARITVKNYARSGRSSKSFRTEENYRLIAHQLRPGDFLILQFGHNDSKQEDPFRHTRSGGSMEEPDSFLHSLCVYLELVRKKGVAPILATPISRNRISDPDLEAYAEDIRRLGALRSVPVLDLYQKTNLWIRSVGTEQARSLFQFIHPHDPRFTEHQEFCHSQYYHTGSQDSTHLNFCGAQQTAFWAVEEIRRLNLPLADYCNSQRPCPLLPY